MKKLLFSFAIAAAALISCTKSNLNNPSGGEEATLGINVTVDGAATKATGDAHGVQANDNTVATLDVFVFNNDPTSPGYLKLTEYKRFLQADGLSNLQVKTTTGPKRIYAVANSHKNTWTDVQSFGQFQALTTSLKKENTKDFVMIANQDVTMAVTTNVSLTLERQAAKVILNSFKTAFAGGPYEGKTLSNIKVYLVNVNSEKVLYDGSATPTTSWLNLAAFSSTDVASCAMTGCIADDVAGTVGDAGHTTSHHFYAFENLTEVENATDRMTRLVIEAVLDGVKYYYPINVNQPDFGWNASTGHKGLKRNHQYSMDITITRPGSDSPDKPISYGTASITCTVSNWVPVDCGTIEE